VEPFSLSNHYTDQLKGKTVESVEHHYYGDTVIEFTDGTEARLQSSGTPPTIFFVIGRRIQKIRARVFSIGKG
jgi:predicted NAD-dependent protein-ADP-ribosyltransferase YbiA (DUF1768 family)